MKVRNEKSLSFILAIFMCLTFLLTVSCTTHENTQQNTDPTAAPVPTAAPTDEIISDPTREQYIQNINHFHAAWEDTWTAPDVLLDFDKKLQAFKGQIRPLSVAHRGGMTFYPENSIEAIISSAKMGVDIIEIDLNITKDGVLVLGHGTLDVFTDWEEKRGKNGLPKSNQIISWTYEELKQLNLKYNDGQYATKDGITTEYIIPTFEEVMTVANGRIFVTIDKIQGDKYWEEIYAVLKKTNSTQSFLFGPSFKNIDLLPYQRQMEEDGLFASLDYYSRKHTGDLETELTLSGDELTAFFVKYDGKKNSVMIEHELEFVKYISGKYING